jgi:nucleoside-diphosphate-sugar epimerase
MMKTILVTGACGQIGADLTGALRTRHGETTVLATSRRRPPAGSPLDTGPFDVLDVTDRDAVDRLVQRSQPDAIYHLAARLSAIGETDPQRAWDVNMGGLLEAARTHGVRQLFWPSSIAVFGPDTPREHTPQDTVMRPTTIYGVSKVAGELLCDYYVRRYRVDVRGVRYPGVISSEAPPGGGTTDYAVAMFHGAISTGRYACFVREDTVLPMIYMPDCIKAAVDLMAAESRGLRHHNAFNLAAMRFSAGDLAQAIRRHVPHFTCTFEPDERQAIADSWPRSLDDTAARREWGWRPDFDLPRMTADMLGRLRARPLTEHESRSPR